MAQRESVVSKDIDIVHGVTNEDVGINADAYPTLYKYAAPLAPPVRDIVGREADREDMLAALERPELPNVMLLAPAGSGKTALVQSVKMYDTLRLYMEVDLAKMISDLENPAQMAGLIKEFFGEATRYFREQDQEMVLFIDEFHQIVQMSEAAVEALKPVLAASGVFGLRIIAATTFDEYNMYVEPNQPLKERLQRILLEQLPDKMVVRILREMAARYGVEQFFQDDTLLWRIVELTNRYVPASVQPRQSILVMDSVIGRHRRTGDPINRAMIDEALRKSTGVNVNFAVDGREIKDSLNGRVFAQERATEAINKRLQICVADLQDKTRPLSSFLFVGSTGVGKSLADDTLVPVWDPDEGTHYKRHGDLQVGDFVFNRYGEPEEIAATYRNAPEEFYRITFTNDRVIEASASHIWPIYTDMARKKTDDVFEPVEVDEDAGIMPWKLMTTREMFEAGACYVDAEGAYRAAKYYLPASSGVQWPDVDLPADPYVLGVFIAAGCVRDDMFSVRGVDDHVVGALSYALKARPVRMPDQAWQFEVTPGHMLSLRDVFGDALVDEGVITQRHGRDRRIPDVFLTAGFTQRQDVICGLFDAGGYIRKQGYTVHYQSVSQELLTQMKTLLASVGIDSSVSLFQRGHDEHDVAVDARLIVRTDHVTKQTVFRHSTKLDVARLAAEEPRSFSHRYDTVGVRTIEPIGEQEAQCILVDHPEHMYQAGDFIVTHNTEMAKQLADLMFGDDRRRLVRFDMSEYAHAARADVFRSELTRQISNMGHAVLLIDEVEKAHPDCYRLLLQVMDDGILSDDNGRPVTFLNTYIILTTNVGASIFSTIGAYAASDTGDGSSMEDFEEKIYSTLRNQKFPPELLGRVDAVVPFQPLSQNTKSMILQRKIKTIKQEVWDKHGVKLRFDERVLTYLDSDRERANTNSGGARDAVRTLNNEVISLISEYINAHPEVAEVAVKVDGTMRSDTKATRKGNAKIVVGKVKGSLPKPMYR